MDLYRMALGGGDPIALTADYSDEFDPRWSPDAREIAFCVGYEMRVMPADGGPATILASSPAAFNDFPQWSPTGLHIAFLSTRTRRAEVWIVSRDSVGGRWHDAVQVTTFGCVPLDWTPDGNGVLCRQGLQELITVSRQGAELRRLNLAAEHGLTLVPSNGGGGVRYSRDGRSLYFAAARRDGRRGIWAIPAAGGRARLIVTAGDPSVILTGPISVGPDRLYVTVSQYESDIWVAKLKY